MEWKEKASEEDEPRLGGKSTPWLYLAFDFRAATLEKVSIMGRLGDEGDSGSISQELSYLASKRMLQRCQHKDKHKEVRTLATMKGLDVPVCRWIDKVAT